MCESGKYDNENNKIAPFIKKWIIFNFPNESESFLVFSRDESSRTTYTSHFTDKFARFIHRF